MHSPLDLLKKFPYKNLIGRLYARNINIVSDVKAVLRQLFKFSIMGNKENAFNLRLSTLTSSFESVAFNVYDVKSV